MTPDEGMVLYDVEGAGGGRLLRVGTVTASGAVVLLPESPVIYMSDPATVTALEQALEQARVDQARIHNALYPPPEVSTGMLSDALAAYRAQSAGGMSPRHRVAMVAALTAANIYEPELLDIALRAFRRGEHSVTERMRAALAAVLQATS